MHAWIYPFIGFFTVIAALLTHRTHWSLGVFFLYAGLNGLLHSRTTPELYSSLLGYAAFAITIVAIPRTTLVTRGIIKLLTTLCACLVTMSLIQAPFASEPRFIGFVHNPSINMGAIAILCPLIYARYNWPTWVRCAAMLLILMVLIGSKASAPLLGIAAGGVVYLYQRKRRLFYLLLAAAPAVAGSVYALKDTTYLAMLLNPNGRWAWWGYLLQTHTNPLLGMGLGFTESIIPIIGGVRGYSQVFFPAAHNDYLQLYMDLGFIGVGSFSLAVFHTLRRAHDRAWLVAALTSFLAVMAINWPLHEPLNVLILMLLIVLAFNARLSD